MIRLPSFSFCNGNFLHHLVHPPQSQLISFFQEKVLSVACSTARQDQQETLPIGGADRGRQGLLHRGARGNLRGGSQRVEVQLCLLAGPGARDHARHLVRFNIIPWTRNTIQKSKISTKKTKIILGPKLGTLGSNFARERLILLDLSTKRPEKYVSRLV